MEIRAPKDWVVTGGLVEEEEGTMKHQGKRPGNNVTVVSGAVVESTGNMYLTGFEHKAHYQLCRSTTEKGKACSIELRLVADPGLDSVIYWLDGFGQVIFLS